MATLRNPETLLHEITIGYFARQAREKSGTAGHYGVLALEEILSERALELARGLSTPIALQSIPISETFSLDDSPICGASVKADGEGRKVECKGRRLSADPFGLYEVHGGGVIHF